MSSAKIYLNSATWIRERPQKNIQYKARFRHGGNLIPVNVEIDDNKCLLKMIELERAITPGQSAVLYKNDECIGGGVVETNVE